MKVTFLYTKISRSTVSHISHYYYPTYMAMCGMGAILNNTWLMCSRYRYVLLVLPMGVLACYCYSSVTLCRLCQWRNVCTGD